MEWLIYLSKVSVCMGLFYAFYYFFLQKLTFFSLNRFYLLATLILSFVIPLLQFQVQSLTEARSQVSNVSAVYTSTFTGRSDDDAAIGSSLLQTDERLLAIDWKQALFFSYLLIVIIMLSIFVFQAIQLLKHTRQVNQKIGRLKVVFKQKGFTNCSFLNYVFLNRQELSDEEMAVILHHENVHISRYHSIDKLVIAACKALLWFNPLVYLYDKALEEVHEYEADKETSTAVGNTPYANILLTIAVRNQNSSLAHSFVRNPLKGRIKMLFTNQSNNMKKLMYFAVLPLGTALVWTFAVQVVYASHPEPALKETLVKPVQIDKASLETAVPYKGLKTEKPSAPPALSDTLWMIDNPSPTKYSEVIIDGKSYGIDILSKISPRCISTTRGNSSKIEITTHKNKIEYATKIDRENVIVRRKALASGKGYVRYPQKHQDGSRYDEVSIMQKNGAGGSVGLARGEKLLLIFNGKQYSEQEFKSLAADQFKGCDMSFRSGVDKDEEIKAKYGNGYGSMIKVSKSATDSTKKEGKGVFRRPMGMDIEDGYGKFSYSAQDSTVYVKGFADVLLYGDVKMSNDQISIKADKIKFNGTDHIALAKNVSFTQKGKAEVKGVPFVRFNLRAGTYKVLEEIKGF